MDIIISSTDENYGALANYTLAELAAKGFTAFTEYTNGRLGNIGFVYTVAGLAC